MDDPTLWIYAALLVVAFVAGVIDTLAGGGGLLVLPALLLAGIPPLEALGTNKLQALFGTGSATVTFARKGYIDIRSEWPIALACFAGSVLGAITATIVPTEIMRAMMPVVLITIALYFLLQKNLSDIDRKSKVPPFLMGFMVLPTVGFYDGIFGPGAGSFYMLALVSLGGFGLLKATARTKFMNFASNVGSFISLAAAGVVIWPIGLSMAVGNILGANVGARLAINNGARLIRPLLVVLCVTLAIKLLLQ